MLELEKGQLWRLFTIFLMVPAIFMLASKDVLSPREKRMALIMGVGTITVALTAYFYNSRHETNRIKETN